MEQRLLTLMHDARRWTDHGKEYLPTLGCSKCGQGCMPLSGLGLDIRITPMESKDVVLKSRKTMLETSSRTYVKPTKISIVSSVDIVISAERALDCIEQREITGVGGRQTVFTHPIPTLSGLICKDCRACTLCLSTEPTSEIRHDGRRIRVCADCLDECAQCQRSKIRHHACCAPLWGQYRQ